jgi:hypothetical protein
MAAAAATVPGGAPDSAHNFFTNPLPAPDNSQGKPPYLHAMKMRIVFASMVPVILLTRLAGAATAEPVPPPGTFAKLPIKEITVFKDGHAFVAHEGEMPTDDRGNVVMDYLPAPVIGTFWPYVADKRATMRTVVAGQRRVAVEHTALNLRELLEANVGAEVIISESPTNSYEATIAAVPARSADELTATSPPNSGDRLPVKGSLILLKTAGGVRAVPIDRIQDVTFKGAHKSGGADEEFRNLLTLKLDWEKSAPAKSARVGLFYLQKGVRWIPSYKLELDGQGKAVVKLQATVINELADLDDVSLNLVVGVPTFTFKDTLDPMSLQQSLAQLSSYFQSDTGYRNSPLASQFSNAIMSQSARMGESRGGAAGGDAAVGPDIIDSSRSEDLFVYRVEHVTLRRGERMVLPVAEFTLPYKDVFTLELPFAPPPELRGNLGGEQQREMARLLGAPKAMHKIRLTNNSKYPLTTAPALIVRDGRVLAQGMMTYASAGASTDLAITTAVDVQVKKTELETKRTPNAIQHNGSSFSRVDLGGKVRLTNHRNQPAEIEVTRFMLGVADSADHDGVIEKVNVFEDGSYAAGGDSPYWWSWYNWPSWWNYFNGVGRVTWKLTLAPGESVELGYEWHYFWT